MASTHLQSGWRETTLASAMELVGGGTPKTTVPEYWDGDIPWLSVVDFNDENRWVDHTEKTITQLGVENSSTKILDKGDIIISARGTVGALAQLKRPMAFNQSCYGIKSTDQSTIDFLYYLLKYSIGQLAKNAHGSVFSTITRQTFEKINVLLPAVPEQRAIAAVLSSFDNKIELLRNQNKTLEAIAQQLFHEWFVEFNFPNGSGKPYKKSGGKMVDGELGEMPEEWKISGLSEIADFLNGLALQKFPPESPTSYLPVIKIREMKSGISDQTDKASVNLNEKYIVHDGDVLFSWSGSLEVVLWKYGKGALNQHLFKVTSQNYPKWFYYHWLMQHLDFFRMIASVKATTMGHIQRYHLDEAKAFIPTEAVMKKADMVFAPLLDKIIANNAHIFSLTLARESLLPSMMSGEVRVQNYS